VWIPEGERLVKLTELDISNLDFHTAPYLDTSQPFREQLTYAKTAQNQATTNLRIRPTPTRDASYKVRKLEMGSQTYGVGKASTLPMLLSRKWNTMQGREKIQVPFYIANRTGGSYRR
jgi:hypothetical protein